MGTKVDPRENGPPGKINKKVKSKGNTKRARCFTCGQMVEFDTDRNGHHLAFNPDLTVHRCRNA